MTKASLSDRSFFRTELLVPPPDNELRALSLAEAEDALPDWWDGVLRQIAALSSVGDRAAR